MKDDREGKVFVEPASNGARCAQMSRWIGSR
jgi:hypothetical protein